MVKVIDYILLFAECPEVKITGNYQFEGDSYDLPDAVDRMYIKSIKGGNVIEIEV